MIKYIATLILIFFTTLANSEVINKIVINGNDRVGAETIKVYGDIELNKDYSKNDLNQILKNLYETNFFETIDLNIAQGTLTIQLKEYPIINSLELKGEKTEKIQDAILKTLQLQKNNSFIRAYLAQDIQTIKKIYATLGFNFAEVDSKVQVFDGNRLNLEFTVSKGTKTKISKINFIGDKKVKEKRLRDIIVSEEDKLWKFISNNTNLNYENIELDKRLLKNYYKSNGYYDVQILSSNAEISNDGYTSLTYSINAGTRYKINKISTNISPALQKNYFLPINDEFVKLIGNYYSPFKVKKLLDSLDGLITENDLQFVEHSVNEIIDGDKIEIKINIFEGVKQLVERIDIRGNTITNEEVIRAELELDEGEPFSNLKLSKSINNLKARNIFGQVTQTIKDGSAEDLKEIEITVEEKPTGEISAGAGIGTQGPSLAFSITENNWMGQGVQLSTAFDLSKESLKGSINLTNPNYRYSGNALNLHVDSTNNDKPKAGYENSLISAGIGTTFEQYQNIFLSPSIEFSYDDLKVLSTASQSLKNQAGSFTEMAFAYRVTLDERNKSFMPTEGYLSAFRQIIPVVADSPYLYNNYRFAGYNAFSPNVVGAFKFYGAAINGLDDKDVRISKRLQMSTKILRGFAAGKVGPFDTGDYVGGNYTAAVNFEAALPNLLPESTKTDIGFFLDFANIWGVDYSDLVNDTNKIRSSTGMQVSWISPLGPMTAVFSQNISKASTDETESFSFKIGPTF